MRKSTVFVGFRNLGNEEQVPETSGVVRSVSFNALLRRVLIDRQVTVVDF